MRLVILAGVVCTALFGQSFEVASIKAADPKVNGQFVQILPGGVFRSTTTQLGYVVEFAYDLKEYQLAGIPKWMSDWDTSRFSIEAKAAGRASDAEVKDMVKALLADRFQLKVHHETRELPVYALVAAKGGFKFQVVTRPGNGGIENVEAGFKRGYNSSVANFIRTLPRELDRPVIDKTGFTGRFDFELKWAPPNMPDDPHPSIFTALEEQLGLKLQPEKDTMDALVIDHVERPSEN